MKKAQGQRAQPEYGQRSDEQLVDALFIQQRDQAPDPIFFVILPVAIIKNDADGIDEEEAAGYKQDKGMVPSGIGHDDRQNRCHVDPDKGKEEGFSHGYLL